MVVYTGIDSKLILNLGKYVYKMSSFERILNRIMVINLILAIVIAIFTAVVAKVWNNNNRDHQYIFENYDDGGEYFIALFRVYLIVNSFVPLDLLAMLEISKLMFTPMMQNDAEMVYVEPSIRDTVQFKANTLNLAEELAQVEYIFCDKTGTLTQNELVFRALTLQQGQEVRFNSEEDIKNMRNSVSNLGLSADESETFNNFFRCINLCHDCITLKEEKEDKSGKMVENVVYNGPSVDEVCLLEMCKDTGIGYFNTRDATSYKI